MGAVRHPAQRRLEGIGLRVDLSSLAFQDWLKQVFNGGDFDMSIVAHVEPRDLAAVFGNPAYYTKYTNAEFTAALAAAEVGTETEFVDNTRKAARILAEDAGGEEEIAAPAAEPTRPQPSAAPVPAGPGADDLRAELERLREQVGELSERVSRLEAGEPPA